MYIVFEGVIGTGKTTQSKKTTDFLKSKFPEREIIWTKQPGGSPVADEIRKVVQVLTYEEEMDPLCEAYLYASSRAHTLRTLVYPVLKRGGMVVSDRSHISSMVNQGFGRDLGFDKIHEVNKAAIEGFEPDYIFFLDLPIEEGIKRAFDNKGDKFENLGVDFYAKVYKGYLELAKSDRYKSKWVNIDATGDINIVFSKIKATLDTFV